MTRLRSWNAYESDLSGIIDDSVLTFSIASTAALSNNTWLCIDPDDPLLREYVFAETVVQGAPGSITVRARGEEGSANPLGSGHDGGAKVRAIPVHQWLDEIFTDIEGNATDLTDHEADVNPHPVYLTEAEGDGLYVNEAGDTMTGLLTLSGAPTLDLHAATKLYVDDGDTATLAAAQAYSDGLDHDHATPIEAHNTDAGRHADLFALYLPLAGGIMLDSIDMDSNKILRVGIGTDPTDAIQLSQLTTHDDDVDAHHAKFTDQDAIDATDGTYLKLTGGTVSGLLTLSSGLTVSSGVSSFSGVATFGAGITFDSGSVGSPSLKFTGTDTGFYLRTAGNNGIGFSVDGGADADVVLTSSGWVPIKAGLDLGSGGFPWDNIQVNTINGQPVSAYLNP